MYIPIKNINEVSLTNNGQQNKKGVLFVDQSDFNLKLKFLDKVVIYKTFKCDTNIDDNEQSSSGSGNTSSFGGLFESEGPSTEYVYKIENSEDPLMNGYYRFKEYDNIESKIIYENENGSAWLYGYRGMEWSIETADSYYSTGPIADDKTPDKYVEYYINVDEGEVSNLKIKRVNKTNLLYVTACVDFDFEPDWNINGIYYELTEFKDIFGHGKSLYTKDGIQENNESQTMYLVYSDGDESNGEDCECTEPYYAFVGNLSTYEPIYRLIGETPVGDYSWVGHYAYVGGSNTSSYPPLVSLLNDVECIKVISCWYERSGDNSEVEHEELSGYYFYSITPLDGPDTPKTTEYVRADKKYSIRKIYLSVAEEMGWEDGNGYYWAFIKPNISEADDYSFESSYFVAKTTKDGLLTDTNLEWKPTGGSIGFDNFKIPTLQ